MHTYIHAYIYLSEQNESLLLTFVIVYPCQSKPDANLETRDIKGKTLSVLLL